MIDPLAICRTCGLEADQIVDGEPWNGRPLYTPGVLKIGRIRFHPDCSTAWLAPDEWPRPWPRRRTTTNTHREPVIFYEIVAKETIPAWAISPWFGLWKNQR